VQHFIEKRKAPRINKSLPIKLNRKDFDVITETKNISCIGVYCAVPKYIEPMTKLKIVLIIPKHPGSKSSNQTIECKGVVVRTDVLENNNYNIAIFFNEIKERDKQKISSYVEHYLHSHYSSNLK